MLDFADDPLVSRVVRLLAQDSGKLSPIEEIDFCVAALAVIAADQKWYAVMQLCLPLLVTVPDAMREDLPEMADDDLAQFLVFGHRISDAIHLKLHGRDAILERLRQVQRPARRWNLPWTDRWVSTDTVRELVRSIRDTARAMPITRRQRWIAKELRSRCAALNARMLDAATFQLIRHSMATGSQWIRLAKSSQQESVQVRIHYNSAYLSVVLRVGEIVKSNRFILPLWVGQMLSDDERSHIDRHFALSFVSTLVFRILTAVRERRPITEILPALQGLYARLFGDLFADPRVQAAIAALGDFPTLVVTAYGDFAQLPFAALHDGDCFLAERFNVVQATPLYRGNFTEGAIDYEAIVGGASMTFHLVRALIDTENLQQTSHEKADLYCLADKYGFDLTFGPVDGERWTNASLRWLFGIQGVALLSAHMLASASDAVEAIVGTPNGDDLRLGAALSGGVGADLVVLAGCQSSSHTDWLAPDESSVISLMRSAGADAVISTLWPVGDYATRLYNVVLVEALATGSSRATAHGTAQRAVMRKTASIGQLDAGERLARRDVVDGQSTPQRDTSISLKHPFYWAGLTLTGAWR